MSAISAFTAPLYAKEQAAANSNNTTNSTTTNSTTTNSTPSTQATDPLANESTFLTLLVSQLKNQDPAQPMDGTTFVTQLAQFSDLEQNLAMRQDLDAINQKYVGTAASTSSSATSGTNQPSSTQPANSTQNSGS